MKKPAIVLIVLLLAGSGLAMGKSGSCGGSSCPVNMPCPQSGCATSSGGSSVQSDAGSSAAASACQGHCSHDGCGTAGGCQACCGNNCAACCGAVNN
ncbi:MAG: hypothetical protein EHM14_14270 [Methanothrix sp.]|nr:MAG: hypothetical protein EHM14_14270 [Methanothrix sp.]